MSHRDESRIDSGAHDCLGGCGRRVSGNKFRCMSCIEEAAAATVTAKKDEPLEKTTHIIMQFASQNREDLYRADGMLLASRQGEMVRFGMEPKEAGNRFFLSSDFAGAWLRKLAGLEMFTRKDGRLSLQDVVYREDVDLSEISIEERNAEHLIHMPSGGPVDVMKN